MASPIEATCSTKQTQYSKEMNNVWMLAHQTAVHYQSEFTLYDVSEYMSCFQLETRSEQQDTGPRTSNENKNIYWDSSSSSFFHQLTHQLLSSICSVFIPPTLSSHSVDGQTLTEHCSHTATTQSSSSAMLLVWHSELSATGSLSNYDPNL